MIDTMTQMSSVQRFVIPAADVSRASIVMARTNKVEHVFALIEYVDSMSERIGLTNSLLNGPVSACCPIRRLSRVERACPLQ